MLIMRLLIIIPVFIANMLAAQVELNYFTATATETQVELKWQIKEGNTCNGIVIERLQNGQFSPLGEIQGVCGSSTAAQSYSFSDIDPLNFNINYYRLVMGGVQFSDTASSFFYQLGNSLVEVHPNPVNQSSVVYIHPSAWEESTLQLVAVNGSIISNVKLFSATVKIPEIFEYVAPGNYILYLIKNGNTLGYCKLHF
jgi:hypothetical protein